MDEQVVMELPTELLQMIFELAVKRNRRDSYRPRLYHTSLDIEISRSQYTELWAYIDCSLLRPEPQIWNSGTAHLTE